MNLSLEGKRDYIMAKTDVEKTKQLRKDVAPFAKSETRTSIQQLLNTVVPLLVFFYLSKIL